MSDPERLNDEWLVLRCQEGDSEAFSLLVERWQRRLWRHAWRLTGDEAVAWDVLQEGWMAISRGLVRLVDAAAFPAWAYQIVSHKCRDALRRQRRFRAATELYAEWMQDCQQRADLAERQHSSLKEALEQLSGPDRVLLSLRYDEQFDTAEIAAILGVPEGTVKSRLFYARQRLRKYLGEDDV
jgi:RNA polymerase sigma-70 factor (ECF subfamily)